MHACMDNHPGSTSIGANRPGTSGTVPDLKLLSRVPHGTCFISKMSRKFYSTELGYNYNLPITFVYGLATFKVIVTRNIFDQSSIDWPVRTLNMHCWLVGGVNREVA